MRYVCVRLFVHIFVCLTVWSSFALVTWQCVHALRIELRSPLHTIYTFHSRGLACWSHQAVQEMIELLLKFGASKLPGDSESRRPLWAAALAHAEQHRAEPVWQCVLGMYPLVVCASGAPDAAALAAAMPLLESAADDGVLLAQVVLGDCYAVGCFGVACNEERALQRMRQAAAQGHEISANKATVLEGKRNAVAEVAATWATKYAGASRMQDAVRDAFRCARLCFLSVARFLRRVWG